MLRWLRGVRSLLGDDPTKEQLTDFVWATLKGGKARLPTFFFHFEISPCRGEFM